MRSRILNSIIISTITLFYLATKSFANQNKLHDVEPSLQNLLPIQIRGFKINKTTAQEVQSKLGQPTFIKNNCHYYQLNSKVKYPLEITYSKSFKINKIVFNYFQNKPYLDQKQIFQLTTESSGRSLASKNEAFHGNYLNIKKKYFEIEIDHKEQLVNSIIIK